MSTDLIDMVTSSLSPEQVENSASKIGLPSSRLQPLMGGAVATVLAGLLHRSSTPAGRTDLMEALPAYASPQANREGMLDRLLGKDKVGPLSDVLSSSAGVPRSAGHSLLGFAGTAVVGTLAKMISGRHMDANGLGELLAGQRESIMRHAPPGLASIFGMGKVTEHAKEPNVTVVPGPEGAVHRKRGLGPLIAALAALCLLGLIIAAAASRRRAREELPTITGATMRAPVTEPAPYVPKPNAPEVTQPTAPAPVERAATSLDTFFKGDEKLPAKVPIGKITFPFAATAPTADSMASIDQLATEMKNHPSAKVRLDGFTDSVGKGDANETLSIQRADAVKALLVDRGVDGSRIATGGHSLRHPVADNGTDNGRSENRRVEATLLSR